MGKKEEDNTLMRKSSRRRKKSATITISLDGKGTVFPAKLKLQGELFE